MIGVSACVVLGDMWSIIDSGADNCQNNAFFTNNEIKMIVNKAFLLMLILSSF